MTAPPLQTGRVPGFLHFTADDYRTSAQACRVAAYKAEQDAKAQTNPQVIEGFLASAKRYRELAQKHENAARVK